MMHTRRTARKKPQLELAISVGPMAPCRGHRSRTPHKSCRREVIFCKMLLLLLLLSTCSALIIPTPKPLVQVQPRMQAHVALAAAVVVATGSVPPSLADEEVVPEAPVAAKAAPAVEAEAPGEKEPFIKQYIAKIVASAAENKLAEDKAGEERRAARIEWDAKVLAKAKARDAALAAKGNRL